MKLNNYDRNCQKLQTALVDASKLIFSRRASPGMFIMFINLTRYWILRLNQYTPRIVCSEHSEVFSSTALVKNHLKKSRSPSSSRNLLVKLPFFFFQLPQTIVYWSPWKQKKKEKENLVYFSVVFCKVISMDETGNVGKCHRNWQQLSITVFYKSAEDDSTLSLPFTFPLTVRKANNTESTWSPLT